MAALPSNWWGTLLFYLFFLISRTSSASKVEMHSNTSTRSESGNCSIQSQFEVFCKKVGSQPCTCYYPDHPNVTEFELSTDEITSKMSGGNGTGPSNCTDLGKIGYNLTGFYMVRFNSSKRLKAIFCEFGQTAFASIETQKVTAVQTLLVDKSSKCLRFCGGQPCPFFYSDNPDSPHMKLIGSKEPESCEDLQRIGHKWKGFYMVRFNGIKIRILYCDFTQVINGEEKQGTNRSSLCSDIGSKPCSCYYSNHPSILQFELSTDEITRNTSVGPKTCKDLEMSGYNLRGFFMVRLSKKNMKTIYCEFDSKMNGKSTRLILETSTTSKSIDKITHIPEIAKEKQTTTPARIQQKTSTFRKPKKLIPQPSADMEINTYIDFNHRDGRSYLLRNEHGKCLAVQSTDIKKPNEDMATIVQSDCNPLENGQLWKFNPSNLLCNEWRKCLTVFSVNPETKTQIFMFQDDPQYDLTEQSQSQKWYGTGVRTQLRSALFNYCLDISDNSGTNGAMTTIAPCTKSGGKGQLWHFAWYSG